MKQIHGIVLPLLLLLLLAVVSQSSARLLVHIDSGGAMETEGIMTTDAASSSDTTVDFSRLMGTSEEEECRDAKDEECVKKRMMAEAHLDYIYTQHHKPKP